MRDRAVKWSSLPMKVLEIFDLIMTLRRSAHA